MVEIADEFRPQWQNKVSTYLRGASVRYFAHASTPIPMRTGKGNGQPAQRRGQVTPTP